MSKDDTKLICLGVVGVPHGLKGEVRVRSFSDPPENLGLYGPLQDKAGNEFKIEEIRSTSKGNVVRFYSVSDRSMAERIKGTELFIPRSKLPKLAPGEFYYAALIGLSVEKRNGEHLGKVNSIQNFGAGDILEVNLPNGETDLIPFMSIESSDINLISRRIVADPINFEALKSRPIGEIGDV